MTSSSCPRPSVCGVTSHRVGSAAASQCLKSSRDVAIIRQDLADRPPAAARSNSATASIRQDLEREQVKTLARMKQNTIESKAVKKRDHSDTQ